MEAGPYGAPRGLLLILQHISRQLHHFQDLLGRQFKISGQFLNADLVSELFFKLADRLLKAVYPVDQGSFSAGFLRGCPCCFFVSSLMR